MESDEGKIRTTSESRTFQLRKVTVRAERYRRISVLFGESTVIDLDSSTASDLERVLRFALYYVNGGDVDDMPVQRPEEADDDLPEDRKDHDPEEH